MSEYDRLSKEVGWKLDMITEYPTIEQVEAADNKQILTWHRFLRRPTNDDETSVTTAIMSRVFKIKLNKETTNGCNMQ